MAYMFNNHWAAETKYYHKFIHRWSFAAHILRLLCIDLLYYITTQYMCIWVPYMTTRISHKIRPLYTNITNYISFYWHIYHLTNMVAIITNKGNTTLTLNGSIDLTLVYIYVPKHNQLQHLLLIFYSFPSNFISSWEYKIWFLDLMEEYI